MTFLILIPSSDTSIILEFVKGRETIIANSPSKMVSYEASFMHCSKGADFTLDMAMHFQYETILHFKNIYIESTKIKPKILKSKYKKN